MVGRSEKLVFSGSEIDPVDPQPADRRDDLRTLLQDAVCSRRTAAMTAGDTDRASCPLEMKDGRLIRVAVDGGGNAISLLEFYLREARLLG
jgi:hypothetical protein